MKPSEEVLNTDAAPAAVSSPGARLSQARSERGMTVEQVARETNLSPRYVQALEADDYDALPGAAFIRGYLRRYGQLVQLAPDALVADFDAAWRARAPAAGALSDPRLVARAPIKVSSFGQAGKDLLGQGAAGLSVARILSWGSLLLLLLLLAGTLFWNGDSGSDEVDANDPMTLDIESDVITETPEPLLPVDPAPADPVPVAPAADATVPGAVPPADAAAPAVAPATLPAPVGAAQPVLPAPAATAAPKPATAPTTAAPVATVPVISRPLTPGAQTVVTAKPATTTIPVTTLPASPVRTGTAPAPAVVVPATPPAAPSIDSLTFSFSGKSWISVRDATGQELVYGLKNTGQSVTVSGQAPFSINIGNVNVTTLSRNGKAVSLKPYTRGEIASFRLAR